MATTKHASPSKRFRTQVKMPRSDARSGRHLHTQPRVIALAVGAALLPWTFLSPAYADVAPSTLPTGGTVTAGSASISSSGSNMQITQGSNSAILNWQSFSIGSAAWVNFSQPSSSAIALNRVLGNNPSEIFGRLTANGQVFLTNPNGVLFAPSASVEVGALFATTLSIADKDFLAGRYNFYNAGGAGSVINQGHIVTANGYAALAGPRVRNDGIIVASAGTVALAAGDRVSLDMIGDGLISVSVDQAALNASAINAGRLQADGGTVLLTARSANALLDTVVNNSGVIRAHSLVERNGEVILDGGSAGGNVLVGGNYQGKGTEQNAHATYLAKDTTVNADAVSRGNGGTVVVWSDGATRYYGSISARGGVQDGNGGSVEVSGHTLSFGGTVDASAPKGTVGRLLLDPDDITIVTGTAYSGSSTSLGVTPSNPAGTGDTTWTSAEDPGSQTIGALDIQALLAINNTALQAT